MKARASRFGRDGAMLAAPAARYSRVARFRFKLFAVRCDLLIVGAGPAGGGGAGGGGRAERWPLPRPGVVVRRREFDADLVVQAREAGATVLEEARLDGIEG